MASRAMAWSDKRFAGTSLAAGTDILSNLLDAVADKSDTLTVIRIVAELNCHYVVTTTIADADSIVDLGIGVCSVEAFGAGTTAVPAPDTNTEYPPRGWLYVATGHVAQLVTTDGGIINEAHTFKLDIRAMRKLDKGVLFARVVNTNKNVGGAMEVTGRVRVLCKT